MSYEGYNGKVEELSEKDILWELGIASADLEEGLSKIPVEIGNEIRPAGRILTYHFSPLARDFSPPHQTNFKSYVYFVNGTAIPDNAGSQVAFEAVVKKYTNKKADIFGKKNAHEHFAREETILSVAEDKIPPSNHFGEEQPKVYLAPRRLVRDFKPFWERQILIMENISHMSLEDILLAQKNGSQEKAYNPKDQINLFLNPIVLLHEVFPQYTEDIAYIFGGEIEGYDRVTNVRRFMKSFDILTKELPHKNIDNERKKKLMEELETTLNFFVGEYIAPKRLRTFIQYDGRPNQNSGVCLLDMGLIVPGSRLIHLACYFGSPIVWEQFKDNPEELQQYIKKYLGKCKSVNSSSQMNEKNLYLQREFYLGLLSLMPLFNIRDAALWVHYAGYKDVGVFLDAAKSQLEALVSQVSEPCIKLHKSPIYKKAQTLRKIYSELGLAGLESPAENNGFLRRMAGLFYPFLSK